MNNDQPMSRAAVDAERDKMPTLTPKKEARASQMKPFVASNYVDAEIAIEHELVYQAQKWSDLDENRPMTPADHLALLTLYINRANEGYQIGANARDITVAQDSLRKIAAIAVDGMCTHGVRDRTNFSG